MVVVVSRVEVSQGNTNLPLVILRGAVVDIEERQIFVPLPKHSLDVVGDVDLPPMDTGRFGIVGEKRVAC